MGADQTFVKVNSSNLTAKASDLTADYPTMSSSAVPPCMLLISGLAMQKLEQNYRMLAATLTAGKAEAARLAACLQAAGKAYDEADALAHSNIQAGHPSGSDGVTVNPDLPPSAPPAPIGQCTAPPEDDGVEWPTAVQQFDSGDQGSSLNELGDSLYKLAQQLVDHGKKFSMGNTHWEGGAAEAAEGALRRHESWMYDVATQTKQLGDQAKDFARIHANEHAQHPTEADVAMFNDMPMDQMTALALYADYQQKSDDVRRNYASQVNFADMTFKEPPPGAYPSQAVSTGDVAPKPGTGPGGNTPAGGGGPGGGGSGAGGGGGQPTGAGAGGAPPSTSPPVNPAAAQSDSAQPQSGGGEPSGGSPSGGGSPSEGGGSGGGMPAGAGDGLGGPGSGLPGMPDDPGLMPAAADAGAGGGGAGAGGGGGGLGGQPLQPSASAPPLGTGAASGGAAGAGPGGAGAGPGGGSGGGMGGGMGAMGGHGNREGGKDKKRNPNLSADEALYVEDRPFTDPVVGHTRRTKIDDKKETR